MTASGRKIIIGLAASIISGFSLMSSAFADGFSASLEAPILPQFSVGGTLNYSSEIVPNVFLGGSIGGSYNIANSTGGIGGRIGGVYVLQLLDADHTFVNAYVGAGTNLLYVLVPAPLTSSMAISADVNGGVFGRYGISEAARIYGGVDSAAIYNFSSSSFVPIVSGYAGIRLEPMRALNVYLQGAVGLNAIKVANASGSSLITSLGASGIVYDLRAGLYYEVAPQFQVGLYTGFNGGFSLGLSFKYTDKPGTLATPGNYLP